MNISRSVHRGGVHPQTIIMVVLTILFVATGSLAIWFFVEYSNMKTNVDGKIDVAVAEGKKVQADEDQKRFTEQEKVPNRQFIAPDDYGRATFMYPKTWSVYEAKSATKGGDYQAFLHPFVVPSIDTDKNRFAVRVTVVNQQYDEALREYKSLIDAGKLKSSIFSSNGKTGTRFDGDFRPDLRGAAVVFKIRDKTLTVRTDAPTFLPDFENVIKTIDFIQ